MFHNYKTNKTLFDLSSKEFLAFIAKKKQINKYQIQQWNQGVSGKWSWGRDKPDLDFGQIKKNLETLQHWV